MRRALATLLLGGAIFLVPPGATTPGSIWPSADGTDGEIVRATRDTYVHTVPYPEGHGIGTPAGQHTIIFTDGTMCQRVGTVVICNGGK